MRRFCLLIAFSFLAAFLARAAAEPKLQNKSDREVHLVCVAEGVTETGEQIHGPRSFVVLNRPGKSVTLILAASNPLTWNVTVREGTICEKVILGGNPRQAVSGLPDNVRVEEAYVGKSQTPISSVFRIDSSIFRHVVKQVARHTDLPLASFQSVYQYSHKAGPIQVDKVQDDPRLSADYPTPASLADLPKLEFKAHYYEPDEDGGFHGEVSLAEYTLAGPKSDSLKDLPKGVNRVAYDPAGKKHYGIKGHGVVEIDLEKNTATEMDIGLDVPRLSWPCEITFDTRRQRVLLGTGGGGGYLYAYSPETKKWSVLCKRPGSVDAFAYSEKDDCLYGVLFDHGEEGRPAICRVSPEGKMLARVPLKDPIHDGSLSRGPGVCTTQVALAGEHVVILAAPGGHGAKRDGWYIYLVEPKTGKVTLTSKVLGRQADRPNRDRSDDDAP